MSSFSAFAVAVIVASCAARIVNGILRVDSQEDLNIYVHFFAKYKYATTLKMSQLPDKVSAQSVEERLLRGLAYIPMAEQPLHFDYWRDGFPSLKEMMTAPVLSDGRKSFSAVPALNSQGTHALSLKVPIAHLGTDAAVYFDLRTKCTEFRGADSDCIAIGKSTNAFLCALKLEDTSPTSLLDMFGYLALKISGSPSDVYMAGTHPAVFTSNTRLNDIEMTYDMERNYPRVLWPSWVNMYMYLRESHEFCIKAAGCHGFNATRCVNLFEHINQLSLTYAYFVCRILSGEAAGQLCPMVCQSDPCSRIQHAIAGTCYPIGFKIHRFDYFCFCEDDYAWEVAPNRDPAGHHLAGKCVKVKRSYTKLIDDCTMLEFQTFCNVLGTQSCTVDRLQYNRRATCTCRPNYDGIDCSYVVLSACERDQWKGRLMCRQHESNGVCHSNASDPGAPYYCECTSQNYFRWRNGTQEECLQWIPSMWHSRAVRCGYERWLLDTKHLWDFCNTEGCNTSKLMTEVAGFEHGVACNASGMCMPRVSEMNPMVPTYCDCYFGYSGSHCKDINKPFEVWTPWSICYEKGIVLNNSRVKLRYKDCSHIFKLSENSLPMCLNGIVQHAKCPDIVEDLPDTLAPSDYGVASQAVISMWRIVEVMLLADACLLALLIALLLYHKTALAAQRAPVRQHPPPK